mgnify:CR=1 FL=1
MKKSILIIGQLGSGKTTKMKELLLTHHTKYVLDGAVSQEQIESIYSVSQNANSFCIVTTQINESDLSQTLLSKFDIVHCKLSL